MTVQLYLGDCLEFMKTLPDKSVDAVITDPPYNVSVSGAKISRGDNQIYKGKDVSLDFGEWDRAGLLWSKYIDDLARVVGECGVLVMFYDKLHLGSIGLHLQNRHGFQVRHIGAIVKRNPAPQARRVKWQNGLEQFIVATRNKGEGHHFNYKLGQSPDYILTSVGYEHYHPTQKPIEAMDWITRFWSFEGDTIFDPFMGSGTTGVACVQLGRNFIGCEIDPKYFAIAEKRIANAQPPLFV